MLAIVLEYTGGDGEKQNLNSGLSDSETLAFNLLLYCLHEEKVTVGICDTEISKKNIHLVIQITKMFFSYIIGLPPWS